MTSEAIKIDTRQFTRKHGHEPRGRFLWTFRIGTKERLFDGGNGKTYPLFFTMRGEYDVCRAGAVRRAEEKGVMTVSVSSVVYGQADGR